MANEALHAEAAVEKYDDLGEPAVRHLQALIRIDTTNPPGNETPAAEYMAELLGTVGIEPTIVGPEPKRRSVIARLRGTGEKPPLLLHSHLDVVPAEPSRWTHPPFAGEIHDGWLWGRGAIDMKHMVVMSALVLMRLKQEGRRLARDIIFAGVADEEAGCDQGSKFIVDNFPDLCRAEFAVGEAGGFTVHAGGRAVYPVMVAEKGAVWMKLRARGTPGHGSVPRDDNAVVRLAEAIAVLGREPLPFHLCPATVTYLDAFAATQPPLAALMARLLKNRFLSRRLLGLAPDRGLATVTAALLANTANPTMLRAGYKVNVVPGEAEAEVDGRSLPGQTSADVIAQVKALVGEDIEIEVTRELPPVETPAPSPLWDAIVATLAEHHPGAAVVPSIVPGVTDAAQWSRLGARCYGFFPLRFPEDGPRFIDLFHGNDERIPVDGLKWGVRVLYDFVLRFCT
jgi:acetylornithine deacetylase/succinyl-diaminopimelate desuccinylase-like protein